MLHPITANRRREVDIPGGNKEGRLTMEVVTYLEISAAILAAYAAVVATAAYVARRHDEDEEAEEAAREAFRRFFRFAN